MYLPIENKQEIFFQVKTKRKSQKREISLLCVLCTKKPHTEVIVLFIFFILSSNHNYYNWQMMMILQKMNIFWQNLIENFF